MIRSRFLTLLLLSGALSATQASAQNSRPAVIPTLREWTGGSGEYRLPNNLTILVELDKLSLVAPIAKTLGQEIRDLTGIRPTTQSTPQRNFHGIYLRLDPKLEVLGNEGYELNIGHNIELVARTETGLFYGTRTILQMLVLDRGHRSLPCGSSRDWPDYHERGFMLDVGRKFFDIKYLRQYVKFMSWYKLNDLQIHLNDNAANDYSGFRLKSEKYPDLANKDGAYSRKQISDLQDLAAQYHVQITPEIDAPAHARAFTKIRPDLGSSKLPKDHLDLTNPNTQKFMNGIWEEFIPWFRGPYVHIGADEYNGGPGSAPYYKGFINATASTIRSLGKKVRMWGGLKMAGGSAGVDRDIVVSLWYPGYQDPIESVNDGYKIINTHDGYLYIVPFAGYYYQYLNTKYLYESWKPTVFGSEKLPDYDPRVLGGMFAVWNDKAAYPYGFEDVHELVKPAMPTLGEVLWAGHPKSARSYDRFAKDFQNLGDGPGVKIAAPPVIRRSGDLLFGKVCQASENTGGNFGAQNLVDGRAPTRWIASSKKAQWVSINLGSPQSISSVSLNWVPDCFASEYKISVSDDGIAWVVVYETHTGRGGSELVKFDRKPCKYIRLDCLKKAGKDGAFSLFSLEAMP